jgi:hypothetical protein
LSLLLMLPAVHAADAVEEVVVMERGTNGDELSINLKTTSGKSWSVQVTRDTYLGDSIPVIGVSVISGDETQIDTVPNCYFRTATDGGGVSTVAYIKRCSADTIDLRGFIADAEYIYIIEKDLSSPTGLAVRVSGHGSRVPYTIESEDNSGLEPPGSGGVSVPTQLATRRSNVPFPSLEIYVDSYFVESYGEANYVDSVIEQLAFTNFTYAQSGLKQVNLVAIVRIDADIGRNESPLHLVAEMRRLRKRTMQEDSADIAGLLTGKDRSGFGYWGYAEIGGACRLRITKDTGLPINSPWVANGVFVSFDLPTLIQRGWTLMHEMGHVLNAEHVIGDFMMDGNIVLVAPLSAYTATCPAVIQFYQSCQYDPLTKMVTDYYSCP